jgi:hypothetical protein
MFSFSFLILDKGFYLCYDDEKVKDVIRSWPIKVLKISKVETKRYTDHTIVTDFWNSLKI